MTNIWFSFNAVPVFHKIKCTSYDPYVVGGPKESVVDSIHVQPVRKDKRNRDVPARFDTAVINDGTGRETGVSGDLIFLYGIFILLSHRHRISNWPSSGDIFAAQKSHRRIVSAQYYPAYAPRLCRMVLESQDTGPESLAV